MKRIGYLIVWIGLVGLFNLICFVVPGVGVADNSSGFWICYGFVMGSFILHLLFQLALNSEKNENKRSSNIPLSALGYSGLLLMVIVGAVCIKIQVIPNWIGIIACYVILFITVVLLISTKLISENVNEANSRLNAKTDSFRATMDKAQELLTKAKNTDSEDEIKKAYESIRYSEPISYPETVEYEQQIDIILSQLHKDLDTSVNHEKISQTVTELIRVIEMRSNKCKAIKRT